MTTTPSAPDPFFHLPGASEWNACIGSQGREEHYVDGYIEAAIELTTAILAKRLYRQRDTLVSPILYSARHAVELNLKFATRASNPTSLRTMSQAAAPIRTY